MPRLNALRRPIRRRPSRFNWPKPRQAAIVATCVLGLGALVAGGVWLGRAGLPARVTAAAGDLGADILQMTARAGLGVRTISVVGRKQTSTDEFVAALGVHEGSPLLAFDAAAARAELERLAWIRSASVERRFPDTVLVHLTERTPLALWQTHGRFAVIDSEGKEIRKVDPGSFRDLIVVVGDDAPKHAEGLLALLDSEPELKTRVIAAVRVAGRRWDLLLSGDVRVQLPEQEIGTAWLKLAEAERKQRLLDKAVSQIDLRAPDRMTLRMITTAAVAPSPAPAARARPAIRAN